MPGHHTFFGGSTILAPLADYTGTRIDQVNFLACQVVSLILSVIYYKYLRLVRNSKNVRLLYFLFAGVAMCFFCYGNSIKHLFADSIACYAIMRLAPKEYVHKLTFFIAMAYLSYIHFHKVYFARDYIIDVTGPMMIMTQRMTSLAFNVHDSLVKIEELTPTQKKEVVRKIPSALEFFSYAFNYMSILCGPLCFYTDFMAFIDGDYIFKAKLKYDGERLKENHASVPKPWAAVRRKTLASLSWILIYLVFATNYPVEAVLEINGFWRRLCYNICSATLLRFQYYYAWTAADLINNAAGFGFNGYDSDGMAKWDLLSNVDVWAVETSSNMKIALDNWNRGTVFWLRRIAYERTPPRYRTVATFALSAWWHGFFPGYYLMFLTAALFTEAARGARKRLRPYFLHNKSKKLVYDVITFLSTRLALAYLAAIFALLHTWPTIQFIKQMYFYMHLAAACLLVFTRLFLPYVLHEASPKTE